MPKFHEFEVSLLHIKPRIWRRFLIAGAATFRHLHEAIQDAGGWENYHLHEFFRSSKRGERDPIAGIPDDTGISDVPIPDGAKTKLAAFFKDEEVRKCFYEYDFGDSWLLEIRWIRTHDLPEKFRRRLLDGKRAFPPEDCGGVWGYEECVAAAVYRDDPASAPDDITDEELEERLEWLGDEWDPEGFDLGAAKRAFDR
ncbi:MAG: plasmid pRiA4b ORF-3 family protein [Deltaproteobacteria bacterium]|nr:plasmid pRiA4b ORF-3 family protein [Deltaproteobacteria bacterium]